MVHSTTQKLYKATLYLSAIPLRHQTLSQHRLLLAPHHLSHKRTLILLVNLHQVRRMLLMRELTLPKVHLLVEFVGLVDDGQEDDQKDGKKGDIDEDQPPPQVFVTFADVYFEICDDVDVNTRVGVSSIRIWKESVVYDVDKGSICITIF